MKKPLNHQIQLNYLELPWTKILILNDIYNIALLRIRKFEQAQVLAEASTSSNFRYCPLIWMFCGKMNDNLIVKSHYRTLRAIYDTQTRSYQELLHLSGKKKIHTQNIQILMVEVYKSLNKICPPFTWDYFKQ